ncbi:MAG: SDR family NAD(P)-dependent oxidoreductase, partial [Ktedonobacteraceae bacterium]|nr:SDR family NAD(P)-dependent oxidoreductase [Ktedonobacteraceae bacterium]
YTLGWQPQWQALFPSGERVPLPAYPWQHQRFWITDEQTPERSQSRIAQQNIDTTGAPLLGTYLDFSIQTDTHCWETRLGHTKPPYLQDHRIESIVVMPGAAFVEMALEAARETFNTSQIVVEEINFSSILVLEKEHEYIVQLILIPLAHDKATFQISSHKDDGQMKTARISDQKAWQLHVSGTVQASPTTSIPAHEYSPQETLLDYSQRLIGEDVYRLLGTTGIHYGPTFRGIEEMWFRAGESLGRIHLDESLADTLEQYSIHPVLLDICFQTMGLVVARAKKQMGDDSMYLPVGVKEIRISQPSVQSDYWIHTTVSAAKLTATQTQVPPNDTLEGDVHLLDEQGRSVLTIKGLRLQRVSPGMLQTLTPQGSEAHSCYELAWHPLSFQQKAAQAPLQDGLWLVFAPAEIAATLLPLLQTPTRQLILIEPASSDQRVSPNHLRTSLADREQAEQLLRSLCAPASPPCRGILYAWGLLTPPAPDEETLASSEHWLSTVQQAALPLLSLLQALLTRGWRDLPRLWVLTSQSQPQEATSAGPGGSPLWGLLRSTMQEHPALHISGIDLPAHPSPQLWLRVAQTLLTNGPEDQWRLREHESHVARLMPLRLPPVISDSRLCQSEGCYVVTGGLGGLGRLLAQWLIEQGARQLLLLGRRPLDEQRQQQLREWAEQGVQVRYQVVDVADGRALAPVLQQARHEQGPLRGLFHLAGVLDDATLLNLEEAAWQKVQRPKIAGSWWLHRLTRQDPLDSFVLFSSAASVLGSAGQSNYAAANAFLDALAWYRRGQGQVALSINWGPWSQVGLAAAERQRGERLEHMGIGSLTPEQGMAWLEALLRSELQTVQVGIWPFHLRQWEQSHPAQAQSPLFAALRQHVDEEGQSQETRVQSRIREQLQEMRSEQERQRFLETYLQEQVARILRLSGQKIHSSTPLKTLGLDSLMALELRNALEENLGLRLSATIAWNYPTLRELAAYIATLMDDISPTHEPGEEESRHSSTSSEFVDQAALELLSDEEVEAALLRQLEQRGY